MLRAIVVTVCLLFAMLLAAAAAAALPSSGQPVPAQPSESCAWTGVWLPFEGEWRLAQNGSEVSGSYLDGKGILSGTVDGDVLNGEWKEAPTYSPPFEAGHFTVTMSSDCSGFVGTWGLGDADCCNVLSAIRDDEPLPSLAVEVERGSLTVDGQSIPPGATYFAPSCPPSGRSPTEQCITFELGDETALKFSCFLNRFVRVMMVLDKVALNDADSEMLLDIIVAQLRERCGLSNVRQDGWALDLAVRQGAAHVDGVVDDRITVAAGPATSILDGPGLFLAGYDAASGKATFRSYSSPLGVQPLGGGPFTLPPYSQVEVTAGGPGPITPLPRVYLPMQNR